MSQPICIIGAGITGMACAYLLAPEKSITILARDMPGDFGTDWASPWAGAVFHAQREADEDQQEMQRASFKFYSSLARDHPSSGVKFYSMIEYFDTRSDELQSWYRDLMPEYRPIDQKDLPEGVGYGVRYTSLAMNPLILLPWLHEQLTARGVKFVRTEVQSIEEARAATGAKLVIHASGNGAAKLAGDKTAIPIRGQTMFVTTDFEESVMHEGADYTYIIPRAGTGGVIIGGIKSDRLDTEVDVALRADILARANRITNGAFKDIDLGSVQDIVGFRPGRLGGIRVEREGDVVHAYGAGGAGYIYSFGVAKKVKELIAL